MKAPETSSKPRTLCPRGIHLARLVQIVDLGTQHFQKGDDGSRKLYLGFETCMARHTFKDENGPEPFMLQIEFAFYMASANPAKPTKLRQFIVKWFGKNFESEQAAKDFDFALLLGKTAMLTVAHNPRTDGTMKAVIADIYLPEKADSKAAPAAHNALICYEIDDGESAAFAKLPEFLRKKIKESDEFTGAGHHAPASPEEAADADDDGPLANHRFPIPKSGTQADLDAATKRVTEKAALTAEDEDEESSIPF